MLPSSDEFAFRVPERLAQAGKIMTASQSTTPLKRLAAACTTSCAVQAKEYGQCILASYTDVKRDMCAPEFAKFKNCVQTVMKRKW
ncbi:hypothetical protein SISNIDRAFT_139023 [Sistotremastrum niveocremeum HHB9708]|uniref:IMS import disulfide relay-system CHCH-CHCH-like Cx9C domain-containing protein n=2 Tax=Sistotremastraceae TaxID=3402574 RepID=A0A165A0E5_9AGAM|nr:hypothetical protein SISNIDRAFT_139023 [Sistotremastrum niveocremeum HHB9708]KZT41468.1 hypothetical protein SISSUDRAFT_281993 [Sistotremastrum suecicum HHB10207 ss-3]